MKISQHMIDYVKSIPIRDVLAHYDVKIPENNMIRCINPHHEDKTPSMYIYDEINIAKCFGKCNKGYDGIEIVRAIDGKGFEDAVMFLYNTFTAAMIGHLQKKKKLDLDLYIKINKELKHIFNVCANDRKMRIEVIKVMQIIDLQPDKNVLILKLYKSLLKRIS